MLRSVTGSVLEFGVHGDCVHIRVNRSSTLHVYDGEVEVEGSEIGSIVWHGGGSLRLTKPLTVYDLTICGTGPCPINADPFVTLVNTALVIA